MNKVVLIGRIAKDLELRYTPNNNAVCEFIIAVNRQLVKEGQKKADFIRCIVYSKQAENLTKYQKKGNLIAVSGEYFVDSWQDNNGEYKYKHYIHVNNIEYLGSKQDGQAYTQNEPQPQQQSQIDPFEEFGKTVEITDNDLPF